MNKVAKLKDKDNILDTKDVFFRYSLLGNRITYMDMEAFVNQFTYCERDMVLNDIIFISNLKNKINNRVAEVFDEDLIRKVKASGLFSEGVIKTLQVNLKCIKLALDRISRLDVNVAVINNKKHAGITVQDLQKITFCDNAWINGGQIITDLACKKENYKKDLSYRYDKKTFITPSGVRCFCDQSGVADRLLVDDINERIMKYYDKFTINK